MNNIHQILAEINESNSSNHKLAVLQDNVDNEFLKRVLQMTHDSVKFTYGVSLKQIAKFNGSFLQGIDNLNDALDVLDNKLCTRLVTGHAALQLCADVSFSLSDDDSDIFKKIINRDLRLNFGKTQINKVWKGLITKPSYMRCDTYTEKTAKGIKFPAFIQKKADGTYREFTKDGPNVQPRTRSGEEHTYPLIEGAMQDFPDGVIVGELTVRIDADNVERLCRDYPKRADAIREAFEKKHTVLPRATGNGMINSSNIPHDDLIFDAWDYITLEEYAQAALKNRKNPCVTEYQDRLAKLTEIIAGNKYIDLIEGHEVQTLAEALKYTSDWMEEDFEGGILKNKKGVFKDGTSKDQLKLKLKIDCEMRITGFTPGNKGSKNEHYFAAITFENDEGTIKGQIGVTTMTEAQRDWFHERREYVMRKIMSVGFNDLSKASGNDFYALSHPKFFEIRNDKDTTDTLEQVMKYREMAMQLK